MLSKPFPSKGTATAAAKEYATKNNITAFMLTIAAESRKFHFTDQKPAPNSNQIVFARYRLIKGKWRDKMPLGKVERGGGVTVKTSSLMQG